MERCRGRGLLVISIYRYHRIMALALNVRRHALTRRTHESMCELELVRGRLLPFLPHMPVATVMHFPPGAAM